MSLLGRAFDIAYIPGQGRDSRIPDGWPSLTGTALESAAITCTPGRTIALSGATLPSYAPTWSGFRSWHPDEGRSVPADADTWGGIGYWDRNRKRTFIYNDRTAAAYSHWNRSSFSSYLAADHRWIHNPLPTELIGRPHVYCRNAYDDSRGHFYRAAQNDRIHRYNTVENEWEHFAVADNGEHISTTAPMVWHEGLDMLITGDTGNGARRVWGWANGDTAWTDLGAMVISAYQSLMVYNRTRGDALMVDDTNTRNCRLVLADGTTVEMPPAGAFATLKIATGNITYDPVSGNYLLRSGRQLYELNPEAGEWRLQTDWSVEPASNDWPGAYYGRPFIVIDDLGVLLWQTYYGVWVYKPASAF